MKNTFVCPHCQGVLNPNVKIVLAAKCKRRQGLVLLSPQPGNYKYLCDPSLQDVFQPGVTITFSCPLCAADLTAKGKPKFTHLEWHVASQEPRRVEFSRIFGTYATFILDGDEVTSYGEDAGDFKSTNFFGS